MDAKVLYFLRKDETKGSLYEKIKSTWVQELWDQGFFEESKKETKGGKTDLEELISEEKSL